MLMTCVVLSHFFSFSLSLICVGTTRSINEEEATNNSFEERDENEDRVVSFISKCSEETDDDASVSELSKIIAKFILIFPP